MMIRKAKKKDYPSSVSLSLRFTIDITRGTHGPKNILFQHLKIVAGSINMPRVYGNVNDATLQLIDSQAGANGLNRSEWISKAIESYLHLSDAEVATQEMQQQVTERNQRITHLEELLRVRESEIQHLRNLTNDLRGLADNLAAKVPALPPSPEEIKSKKWYQLWK